MQRRLSATAVRVGVGVAVAATSWLAVAEARAQAPSLELRGFSPPTDPSAGLYLEPAVAPGTGDWNTALWLSYAFRPVTLRDAESGETAFDVLGHQLSGDFVFNVGLFERLAIGVDLPFAVLSLGDDVADSPAAAALLGDRALPVAALGDAKLVVKGTIVPPTNEEFGGFAMALHERLGVPTGNEASFLGEGSVTSETRLLFEYRLVAVSVNAALGFRARAEREPFLCGATPEEDCDTVFGHELPWGFGVVLWPQAFGIDDEGHWTWILESYGYLPAGPDAPFTNAELSQAQLAAAARYAWEDVSLLWGAEVGLAPGVGTAPFRGTVSIAWAPRKHDIDDDAVKDADDLCRDIQEDLDGYQDEDGCPDWDNDDDSVPDEEDRCEGQQEDLDEHQDDDGCPDLDNDGDGLPDGEDACPDMRGDPAAPDPERKGCPDDDPDRDQVRGEADSCPTLAEDPDHHQDDDGCPDRDNDGDGVDDVEDACGLTAGARTSDPKTSGCPDGDGDGVVDELDRCPTAAGPDRAGGEWSGCPDADGDQLADEIDACPDDAGPVSADPKRSGCPKGRAPRPRQPPVPAP